MGLYIWHFSGFTRNFIYTFSKYIKRVGAAKITMIEMLSGVIISLLFILNGDYTVFNTSLSYDDLLYLIILDVLCTAMVFVWMTEIMRHISPYSLIMAII